MPTAEIITIGTEILLGEIVDTNARYIARKLRDLGIDLYRKSTVGDNIQRIAQEIQHALQRSEIVLTTGGLGPTVDDPTRQAVALAADLELEFHPELWEQIKERFRLFNRTPTENNRRQAFIPQGAQAIENPVGTAPAFLLEIREKVIICLPGVPLEMEYLFDHAVIPFLNARFQVAGIIKARLLHTIGVGESQIDDLIGDLETLSNPSVGLAAHSGQVDVRITAKAGSEPEADKLIAGVEEELMRRIGKWVYGTDQETLEEMVFNKLHQRGWTLSVVEFGLGGELIRRLSNPASDLIPELRNIFQGGRLIDEPVDQDDLRIFADRQREEHSADCCLGIALRSEDFQQNIDIVLITPEGVRSASRSFGGVREYAPRYALHAGLALLLKI